MQVDFYHLTVSPLPRTLARIAERLLGGGGRLVVVHGDDAMRRTLDRDLWTYAPDSFLPHGFAGEGDDTAQPVLIAAAPLAPNGARNIALCDGEWREDALAFDRAFHFFDDETVAAARAAWRALADRPDVERRYWKQTDRGGWEQAA
jgi:DNA polymerase III subunit chi